ncbi:ER membrane protein [Purpureocillium lavendulum]|uniref:ER membrane protein n=1 Tax=Purpureocillium lavendulum TaxID=1247861 RepID=A0AB34FD13_9HYPO|nr:ER membrane protein [Purpureocillium lavendulum]
MKLSSFSATFYLATALAMPHDPAKESHLEKRDNVKLNQYRTLDDCQHDRNILFHAAPVSGKCYELDGQTGAFFYNTGGYLQSHSFDGHGCSGTSHKFQRYTGRCVERGSQNSVRFV